QGGQAAQTPELAQATPPAKSFHRRLVSYRSRISHPRAYAAASAPSDCASTCPRTSPAPTSSPSASTAAARIRGSPSVSFTNTRDNAIDGSFAAAGWVVASGSARGRFSGGPALSGPRTATASPPVLL